MLNVKVLKVIGVLLLWAAPFGSLVWAQTISTTQIDANTQIRNWRLTPLNSGVPVGKANLYTYDNHAIIQNLINSAYKSGLCQVYLPPGIWYTSAGFDIPTCVQLVGVGFGQGTLFGGPSLGTVVQAMPSFTGPSGYPSHFMLSIDGSTTVGPEADTYNAGASWISFDCAGVSGCSGLYVGHANEDVSVHDSVFANYSDFGEYHCGAGLGYSPWLYCGDNGSGPYFNNQLVSYGSWVTASTYPLVIMSSLGNRPWSNYTINNTPGPVSAALVQGVDISMNHIHIENSTNGAVLGPTSGLCAALSTPKCLGLQVATIDHLSLGPTGSGYAVVNQNSISTVITATRTDGQGAGVIDDQRNSVTVPNSYNGWYLIQDSGSCFSFEYCPVFNDNVTLFSPAPTITLRNNTSPFNYDAITETPGGDLQIGGSGGTKNTVFTNGYSVLSMRSGTSNNFNGVNIQSPLGANSGAEPVVNALLASNLFWDTSLGQYRFGNIGGVGYAAAFGSQNGGWGISTSNVTQPGTLTHSQFLANTSVFTNNVGHTLMVPPGSGGAYNATDGGQELQVTGGFATDNISAKSLSLTGITGLTPPVAFSSPGFGIGATSFSCTTGATAGSTCTDSIAMHGVYNAYFLFAPMCQLRGNNSGVPTISSTTYAISSGVMTVTVTITNVTAVAAQASADWCMVAGESGPF